VSLTAASLQVIFILKYNKASEKITLFCWYQMRPGPKYQFSPWSISQISLFAPGTSYQGINLFH
jgi:hypothetical protein